MADSPYISNITEATFDEQVVAQSHRVPVLVDYWADWCGPCQMQLPVLLKLVEELNNNDEVNGILVQLPLPKHIDDNKVLYAIDPNKDVDGFHPVNVGRLVIGEEIFPPCTPAGIQELIVRSGTETKGAEVVVVGRSNIVGKPIANMMLQKGDGANSTVTVVHTRTKDLEGHCKRADILIVAAGVPGLVKPEWIKPGACVIDVGVNRIGTTDSGKAKLAGDVDYDEAVEVANYIAPEHLELSVEEPQAVAKRIRHAGAIFMGRHTCESLGDYCAGPNHVLPTSRTARFSSPLGVYDFQKRSSLIMVSGDGADTLGRIASTLAHGEGLTAHARSAEYRLKQ
mgnify:CR=1 FL=1